tara:strand:- start:62 stop:1060 length:999 start_codon:yes stop_codon:yes gene_type:complete
VKDLNQLINNKITLSNDQEYALIIGATPSQGARSPKLWNKVYKLKKKNIRMYPADVSEIKLKNLVKFLKTQKNFIGGSITAPYKVLIMKYLDKIDNSAKKIGSINTIVKKKNTFTGFNTDYHGASQALKKYKNKKRILVLGCGGASKAVILALNIKFKDSNFFYFNKTYSKVKLFLKKISKKKNYHIFKKLDDLLNLKKIDLIVNTTSVGFNSWINKNKSYYNLKIFSPITNLNNLKKIQKPNLKIFALKNRKIIAKDNSNLGIFFKNNPNSDIFDIIYNPLNTKIMKFGYLSRKKIYNGLEMNLVQAVKAFMIVNKVNNFNLIKQLMTSNG